MSRISKHIGINSTLIRTELYPRHLSKRRTNYDDVLLGIGGNVGDVIRRFEHLYYILVKSTLVTLIETSPILRNPPFGYVHQDDFFNATIYIQTKLQPMELLNYILKLEAKFGRKRSFPDAPRTLDIDILFYNNYTIDKPRLKVPHPYWHQRESVLVPLAQMKGITWLKRHL